MNALQEYYDKSDHRLIHKYDHYFKIYDRYFAKFRNTELVFVEFGISHGGSLQMWKDYFGPNAKIIGIDINPECKKFEDEQVEIYIGSQQDKKFLSHLKDKLGPIDILLDDGGHTMKQQKMTFTYLYGNIKTDGIYLCEDLHTSYWPSFGGGYKRKSNFLEFTKRHIDLLNLNWIYKKFSDEENQFFKHTYSIHYYNSIVVYEKKSMSIPKEISKGFETLENPFSMKASSYQYNIGNVYYKIRKFLRLG